MACAGCARRREKLKQAAKRSQDWISRYVVFDKDRQQGRKVAGPRGPA